jgi:uncharacterized damage-inducible protein DinB
MNWNELIKTEMQSAYAIAEKLAGMVENGALEWKPATGNNWMTTGQLLRHMTQSCGFAFHGFITGDWGTVRSMKAGEPLPDHVLPPAEELPTVESVAEARRWLREDLQAALEILATCSEDALANKTVPAPWDPTEMVLGRRLLQMVEHLNQHKGQLFYYLKLQGKPVGTADLWGM